MDTVQRAATASPTRSGLACGALRARRARPAFAWAALTAAALCAACVLGAAPARAADPVRPEPATGAPTAGGRDAAPEPAWRPCASLPSVRVSAADPRDGDLACDGAVAAVRFFEARGLRTFERVDMALRARVPPEAGARAAGCFLPAERRIVILDGVAFGRLKTWLGVRIERGMHRALAAHEVAHALAACNFAAPRPPVHAQEYVAYVVTLATMEPGLRARVLKANPGDGFATVSTIGELLHAFDSQRFGVESFRHYSKPEHGDAFLRKVLAGEALAD